MELYPGNEDLSAPPGTVRVARRINAGPEHVWRIIGTAEGMAQWLGAAVFQPRIDGRVLLDTSGATRDDRIVVVGRVLEYEPPGELRFSWRQLYEDFSSWPAYTELRLTVTAQPGGSRIELSHSGLERLGQFSEQAYRVYHHCWVETRYLERLEPGDGKR